MEICLRGENEMFVNDNKTKLAQTYTGTMSNLYFQFLSRKKVQIQRIKIVIDAQISRKNRLKSTIQKRTIFCFFENLAVFRFPQKPYYQIFSKIYDTSKYTFNQYQRKSGWVGFLWDITAAESVN